VRAYFSNVGSVLADFWNVKVLWKLAGMGWLSMRVTALLKMLRDAAAACPAGVGCG
jgi:hypothetical protein